MTAEPTPAPQPAISAGAMIVGLVLMLIGNWYHVEAMPTSAVWDPRGDGKMPIRGGFGIYDVLPFPYLMENRTNSFPYFEEGTVNSPPAAAFPTGGLSLITPSSLRASFVEQNPARAYVMEWNLTIQRELPGSSALTVGYVGSSGRNLPRSIEDADQVTPP